MKSVAKGYFHSIADHTGLVRKATKQDRPMLFIKAAALQGPIQYDFLDGEKSDIV